LDSTNGPSVTTEPRAAVAVVLSDYPSASLPAGRYVRTRTPSSDTNSETITLLTSNLLILGCLGW
jgi:hypothetical protein